MKRNSSFLLTVILCLLLVFCSIYKEKIVTFIMSYSIQNKTVALPNEEENFNNYEFNLVQETDNFHVRSRQDILNVIYTILNHGISNFTFYCDKDYGDCDEELSRVSNDQVLLSTINNLVSPYNSYEKIYFQISSFGEVKVKLDKLYSDEDMQKIESKISDFENENIKEGMSSVDKIKAFHDYLIKNSSYDKKRADGIESGNDSFNSNSHKATGPLIDGIALCSGYSDAMKIYLDKLGIPNYKISNSNHIWNLVHINGRWLHLDLTWDDPITSDGSNVLLHKFFLITTDELFKIDSKGHNFNTKYYPEAVWFVLKRLYY